MQEYLFAFYYIIIGLVGGGFHYLKKRYIDNTTNLGFKTYLLTNKQATLKALITIITAEVSLAMLRAEVDFISLSEFVGALTAGYTADSSLNSTNEK